MYNNDLTANNNKFQAAYSNNKYGFTINGTFYEIGGGSMPDLNYTTPLHTFDTLTGNGHGLTFTASKTCYLVGCFQTGQGQPITLNGNNIVVSSDNGLIANGFINGIKLNAGDKVVCSRQELGLHAYGLL